MLSWSCPQFLIEEDTFLCAEEMGFEPMIHKRVYADLANQCLQPLSHSSTISAPKCTY